MSQYLDQVGIFECVVEKPQEGWFGESKEKKTPFIRLPLRVTDGLQAGQRITCELYLTDKTQDATFKRLTEVFGWDGDVNRMDFFAGLPCNIETHAEDYKGKRRVKVKWLNAPGGRKVEPMAEAKVKSLTATIAARAKAISSHTKAAMKAAGTPVPTATRIEPPTTAPASQTPEDDVPF